MLRGLNGRPTSAIYAASRYSGAFRTLKEVASASQVEERDIARCYRMLMAGLNMDVSPEDPVKCVARVAEDAGISGIAQERAIGILARARKLEAIAGKSPMGVAAAALSIACAIVGEEMGNGAIARAGSVTDMTVRNRAKELRQVLGID